MKKLTVLKELVTEYQVTSYLVGGAIRDHLLDRKANDFDLIITRKVRDIAKEFATKTGGTLVVLDQNRDVYRVIVDELEFDFALLEGDTIIDDLLRRDFTINALAVPLSKIDIEQGEYYFLESDLIDPKSGKLDLENGMIKTVSKGNLLADPLRVLRALRFKAQLEFTIYKDTELMMKQAAKGIKQIANERIKDELFKILSYNNAATNIAYLEGKTSLLSTLLPDINQLKQKGQCKYHSEDIWTHSIYALEKLEQLFKDSFWANRIEKDKLPRLKFALLFHDIGKLLTEEVIDGQVHFYGHHKEGATYFKSILKKLTFSNQEVSYITTLIRYHMRPLSLFYADNLTFKGKYRFFKAVDGLVADICLLAAADMLSTRRLNKRNEDIETSLSFLKQLVEESEKLEEDTAERLLNGTDLMELFSLSEGPKIGEILGKIEAAQAAGKIDNRVEAVDYVKEELL
ncbi:HD domain-containing protein [Halanaerocella petrolearia]